MLITPSPPNLTRTPCQDLQIHSDNPPIRDKNRPLRSASVGSPIKNESGFDGVAEKYED